MTTVSINFITETNNVLVKLKYIYKIHVGDGTKYSVERLYVDNLDLENLIPIKVAIAKIQGNMTFSNQMYAVCLPNPSKSLEQLELYEECTNPILERLPRDDEKCIHRIDGKLDFKDIGTPFIMNHNSCCTLHLLGFGLADCVDGGSGDAELLGLCEWKSVNPVQWLFSRLVRKLMSSVMELVIKVHSLHHTDHYI
ncbi:TMPRSS2 [Lepeophtheirus salmonis]|uniref:TMPRSS2 n=1 Tax=Lepeophtheirus salmonis TaxID=72036 RepID=A0A7R8HB92_LEPSM|nr:TMPRSS2 [Lepeophtheirus salmonis]CAF2988859.1 TMPRSS2 [Lepeophtheirus salmonis]